MAGEADLANAAVTALLEQDVRSIGTGTATHSLLGDEMEREAVHVEPFVPHDAVLERLRWSSAMAAMGASCGRCLTVCPWFWSRGDATRREWGTAPSDLVWRRLCREMCCPWTLWPKRSTPR